MKKKAIFFDFDGTIVDSYQPTFNAYAIHAAKYGFPPLDNDLLTFIRTSPTTEIIKLMGIKLVKLPFLIRSIRSELRKRIAEINLHKGIDTIILELANEYEIYIVSSNSKKFVTEYFNQEKLHFLLNYIKGIYCYTSAFGKPRLLKRVLKELHLQPSEVIYVGDEVRDIEACKQIGLPIISVSWGFSAKEGLLKQNDIVADTAEEIYPLIHNINESV